MSDPLNTPEMNASEVYPDPLGIAKGVSMSLRLADAAKTTQSLAPAALSEASHCARRAIKKRHLLTFDGAVSLEQKQST